MKILVCGGRDFRDWGLLLSVLNKINSETRITLIIHGAAEGADALAGEWAKEFGVKCAAYPARWRLEGKAAGPLRNQRMLDEGKPDMVVAFPGGRGTADMVRRARSAGVRVLAVG